MSMILKALEFLTATFIKVIFPPHLLHLGSSMLDFVLVTTIFLSQGRFNLFLA